MSELLTIKDVLYKFADTPGISRSRSRWRTADHLCPLQVIFGKERYCSKALYAGLTFKDIGMIMHWADTGKWSTHAVKEEERNDLHRS